MVFILNVGPCRILEMIQMAVHYKSHYELAPSYKEVNELYDRHVYFGDERFEAQKSGE